MSNAKPISSPVEAPSEVQDVDMCPAQSVFVCELDGLAMTGKGRARMYSALDGIGTIAAILFQREIDKDLGDGIVVSHNVAMGLLNALGSCKELAQYLLKGKGGYSRLIGNDNADYPALERLVNGRPG